jgi:Kdo2-lipid IVA lauroyltransferase/acyltransferase
VKKLRYTLEVSLVRFAIWLMGRLPRQGILVFAHLLGILAYLLDAKGRSTALENLRVALGHRTTWLQRCGIALRCYQNFARTFCDLFWAQSIRQDQWQQHIELVGFSPESVAKLSSGAIWVTPHYGNFEMSSLAMGFAGWRMHIVAQNFKNPGLTDIFSNLRQHSGHTALSQEGVMIRLLKVLKRGGHAAFLTDLNFRPSQATGAVSAFGLMTCVTMMHGLLSQRMGLPIQPAVCEPLPDGRYRFIALPIIVATTDDTPVTIAQRVWDGFEQLIHAKPELWMWMYKHWRYLPAMHPDPSYPCYANANKDFSKQVAAR